MPQQYGYAGKILRVDLSSRSVVETSTFDYNDQPQQAVRPFDKDAAGSVFGEGAGVLVLEELEFAKTRNAAVLAEIVGCASSSSLNPKFDNMEQDGKGIKNPNGDGS